jgi:Tfp pilus assembly protein PilN
MRFTINLVTRTVYDRKLVNLALAAILIVLTVLLAWNIFRFLRNYGELRRLGNDIATEQKRHSGNQVGVSEKESKETLATIRFYNGIIEQKYFGWQKLLEQLELTTPEGIALTSLSLEKKENVVKVDGLAQNFKNVQAYVDNLADSKHFTDVQLLSNKNKKLWEQAKGVEFSLSFRMRAL